MAEALTGPFNQSIRIACLRATFLLILPLVLVVHPLLAETLFGELLEQFGLLLIIVGVLGRFWSILYIGGRKNEMVMRSGPYSMCRHPLYLFSTLATLGFGMMIGSVVLTILTGALVFAILNATASREERYLRDAFGPDYARYAADTPKILPNVFRFRTEDSVTFSVVHLRRNFVDALVFISLIPLAELIEWLREADVLPSILLP